MSCRDSFVEHFGEEQAQRIESAAREHQDTNDKGSDPFRWAIAITIGYECFTKAKYRVYHGITAPVDEVKTWVREHCPLAEHDGDIDVLAAVIGTYNEYLADDAVSPGANPAPITTTED